MKLFVLACCFALVGLSMADEPSAPVPVPVPTHSRGCIYVMGRCFKECEEGTHAYALGCGQKVPEASCDEPNPVAEEGILCDYSACYCDAPTVRDTSTGKCVPQEECPKKA